MLLSIILSCRARAGCRGGNPGCRGRARQAAAEAQVQPQPPQAVEAEAGQPAGTAEPVAGPDNWTWRVQVTADPLARGPYKVYRYITRKADGVRSIHCLMVKDQGHVIIGSEYEGGF
jgi:hypothetical protein